MGGAVLDPATSQSLDLGCGFVQVVHGQVKVKPVLACLRSETRWKPTVRPSLRRRQYYELTISDGGFDLDIEKTTPE
jgi:hypothetical protein